MVNNLVHLQIKLIRINNYYGDLNYFSLLRLSLDEWDQSAAWKVFVILNTEHRQNNKIQNRTQRSAGLDSNNAKTRSHNLRWEKVLPKYDAQSEKTINSCLWLGTILGQQRNRDIDLPTQVTPWPNQIENKQGSLRSGRDTPREDGVNDLFCYYFPQHALKKRKG